MDDADKDTAVANLFDDFQNNTLKLHEVNPGDFVNAKIETLYLDNDSGFETWWEGEVADIDTNSDDPTNPDFFVYYEDELTDSKPEYFLESLLELYLNGSVRFLDCPS